MTFDLSTGLARHLLRASVGSAAFRLAGMPMTFVVGVQLARTLGSEAYGVYGVVVAAAMILSVVAHFGIPHLITRELSSAAALGDPVRARSAFRGFPLWVAGASCVVALLGLAGLGLWPGAAGGEVRSAFWWALALIPLLAMTELVIGALRGLQRVATAQFYDALLRPTVYAGVITCFILISDRMSAATAVALQALAVAVVLLLAVAHLLRAAPREWRSGPVRWEPRRWAFSAGPIGASALMHIVNGQYAVLLLGVLAPFDEVGLFRVALAITVLAAFPATVINLVVAPTFAGLHAARDRERMQLLSAASAAASFLGTLALAIPLLLFGRPLLDVVFGAEFVPAWEPLMLLVLAQVVAGAFGTVTVLLLMCGGEKAVAGALALGPAIGTVVTVSLYPQLGVSAGAIGMIVSEATKGVWMAAYAKRRIGIDPTLPAVLTRTRPLLAALGSGLRSR